MMDDKGVFFQTMHLNACLTHIASLCCRFWVALAFLDSPAVGRWLAVSAVAVSSVAPPWTGVADSVWI
jgi:hypothetical protein